MFGSLPRGRQPVTNLRFGLESILLRIRSPDVPCVICNFPMISKQQKPLPNTLVLPVVFSTWSPTLKGSRILRKTSSRIRRADSDSTVLGRKPFFQLKKYHPNGAVGAFAPSCAKRVGVSWWLSGHSVEVLRFRSSAMDGMPASAFCAVTAARARCSSHGARSLVSSLKVRLRCQ